jgi:chemotaxis protein CheY-P-specific phosphatase CheC
MDESALLEIGNIMVSAFLDATATLLSIIMLPSPPSMIIDMPHAAFQTILAMQEFSEIDQVVIFRTELRSDQHKISSNLFLLPNKPMLDEILSMLENLMK